MPVFVISSSWNTKRDYYVQVHAAFYMDHFSVWVYDNVLQRRALCSYGVWHMFAARMWRAAFRRESSRLSLSLSLSLSLPKAAAGWVKRSQAKPSQAKPTALGSCLPCFAAVGRDAMLSMSVVCRTGWWCRLVLRRARFLVFIISATLQNIIHCARTKGTQRTN
jgi:hypothetical protein